MIQEVSCGIIPLFHNPDGEYEVLLVQNKWGRHRWFPKGHSEEDESPIQTAAREVHEETGISFVQVDEKIFREKYQFSRKDETVDKHVQYFVGVTEDNHVTIDPKEIKAYVRLPLDQVREKLTFYSTRRIRDSVLKYLLGK